VQFEEVAMFPSIARKNFLKKLEVIDRATTLTSIVGVALFFSIFSPNCGMNTKTD